MACSFLISLLCVLLLENVTVNGSDKSTLSPSMTAYTPLTVSIYAGNIYSSFFQFVFAL